MPDQQREINSQSIEFYGCKYDPELAKKFPCGGDWVTYEFVATR